MNKENHAKNIENNVSNNIDISVVLRIIDTCEKQ